MRLTRWAWLVLLVAMTGGAIGCSSSKTAGEHGSAGASAQQGSNITGAGSTFVYPIMTRWISDFRQSNPGVQINYQSIGSGGGIQNLKNNLVDFGASDMALDDQQLQQMPPLIQVPESAGPVCITYDLPELKQPLHLSGPSLAGIYLGTIKNWNDPTIAADNRGVKLPSQPIAVVHRSDGSGTTNIFTMYLAALSPDWASKAGKGLSVSWPVGLGGKGSEGVTGLVKQTPGAIGYVELNYAEHNNLPVALIQNQAREWVKPSAESASAAIEAASAELMKDVRTPIVNPPAAAKQAYPISGLTFLLVPKDGAAADKRRQLKQFITYAVTNGQNISPGLGYSPIPPSVQQLDQKLLSQMTANGQPMM